MIPPRSMPERCNKIYGINKKVCKRLQGHTGRHNVRLTIPEIRQLRNQILGGKRDG